MFVSQLLLVLQASFLLLLSVISIDAAKWTYSGATGPEYWATLHGGELCDGESQSPINIDTITVREEAMGILETEGYDGMTMTGTSIMNTGHTVQVALEGEYKVTGGGLPSIYSAVQFHFHWGIDNNEGSEHTRNGAAYPAEVHIVHYDSEKYENILAAIAEPDGLAVLGFWIEIGDANPAFDPVINALQNVTYKGQKLTFANQVQMGDLLPSNLHRFYRYRGSLTTPGCFESVVWTVFESTVTMSAEQLAAFRALSQLEKGEIDAQSTLIAHNYRPVQAPNGRKVFLNTSKRIGGGGASLNSDILPVFLLSIACFLFKCLQS